MPKIHFVFLLSQIKIFDTRAVVLPLLLSTGPLESPEKFLASIFNSLHCFCLVNSLAVFIVPADVGAFCVSCHHICFCIDLDGLNVNISSSQCLAWTV